MIRHSSRLQHLKKKVNNRKQYWEKNYSTKKKRKGNMEHIKVETKIQFLRVKKLTKVVDLLFMSQSCGKSILISKKLLIIIITRLKDLL